MAINYPGPYGLRMFYTTAVSSVNIQHIAEYNIDMVEDPVPLASLFSAIHPIIRSGTAPTLAAYCDSWVALVRPLLSSGGGNSIDYFELWRYEELSFDAEFVSSYSVGLAGTSGGSVNAGGQEIFVWRTGEGGIMKHSFMETTNATGAPDTVPLASAPLIAIYDFVIGNGNAFIGRDGAMPFALIARYPGQNEALFKRRFR